MSDLERSRKYRQRNKEKVNAAKRAYYMSHKEEERVRLYKWRALNPDKANEQRRKWREENPEAHAAAIALWRLANPEARRRYRHVRRARLYKTIGSLTKGLADRLIKLQRGVCACGCGASIQMEYELDHITPLALGGQNVDGNIQLLTPRCNKVKGMRHPIQFMQSRGFLI